MYLLNLDLGRTKVDGMEVGGTDIGRTDIARKEVFD
jgi:hypothetical protein